MCKMRLTNEFAEKFISKSKSENQAFRRVHLIVNNTIADTDFYERMDKILIATVKDKRKNERV